MHGEFLIIVGLNFLSGIINVISSKYFRMRNALSFVSKKVSYSSNVYEIGRGTLLCEI